MSKLKPCPFCGGAFVQSGQLIKHATEPDRCPIAKQAFPDVEEWIDWFNTRPAEDAARRALEEAEPLVEVLHSIALTKDGRRKRWRTLTRIRAAIAALT